MPDSEPTFYPLGELEPQLPGNKEVFSYWMQLRAGSSVPLWSAFDPLEIWKQMPDCVAARLVSDDVYEITLFGTMLAESFGRDLTGRNLFDAYEPDEREGFRERMQMMITRPATILTTVDSEAGSSSLPQLEIIALPFANEEQVVDHVLFSTNQLKNAPNQLAMLGEIKSGTFSRRKFYSL